jgi:pyruvate kinase
LSAKDRSDIAFALHKGVDALAISFVRTAEDIRQARRYVQSLAAPGVNTDVPLIAKMEKPEAVQSPALEEIIKEADGVMVARGDLGVEVDITRLPRIQKKIIAVANSVSKPVIVATQMLESMLASPQPSRSDVTDIANAVEDGADLLMLSGETSVGQYPAEAVAMMGSIIERTEQAVEPTSLPVLNNQLTIWETYARFFKTLLSEGQAQGIAAYVDDSTVRRSLPAPVQPGWKVLAFTPNERLFRQLSLLRGVQPVKIPALPEGEDGVVAQQAYLKQLLAGTRPTGRSDARPWILLGEAPGERTPWFVLQPALATA